MWADSGGRGFDDSFFFHGRERCVGPLRRPAFAGGDDADVEAVPGCSPYTRANTSIAPAAAGGNSVRPLTKPHSTFFP